MSLLHRQILEDFREQLPLFKKVEEIMSEKINGIFSELGILVMGFEHRVKTEESLRGKLIRKGDQYSSLSDITDILGGRIITYFSDEVDFIGEKMQQYFDIDWVNSCDKRALIKADTFGYLSVHYICYLKQDEGYDENLTNKPFEIQIRTVLQHTWAQINHDMGYKSEFGVPRQIVRELSRVAGLLEIADDKFVEVHNYMTQYTSQTREKIANDEADTVLVDIVSLKEFIAHSKNMQSFMAELQDISGAEIEYTSAEGYISQLNFFKIKTIGDLEAFLKKNHDLALSLAKEVLEGSELDILSSNTGLLYLCRAALVSGSYDEEEIKEFLALSTKAERLPRAVKSILAARERHKDDGKPAALTLEEEERYDRLMIFVSKKHAGQTRKGQGHEPYIIHPLTVSDYVKGWGYGLDYQMCALCHDLLEDTDATEDEIRELAGDGVLEAVKLLTKKDGYVMEEYISAIKENKMASVVKCADRLHNLRNAVVADDKFKKKYIVETVKYYWDLIPEIREAASDLAQTMGMKIEDFLTMKK